MSKNTLKDSGVALIGFGMGQGDSRTDDAAMTALNCPLIEQSVQGARRAICHITCGPKVSLYECQETVQKIIEQSGGQLDLKFGISINDQLTDQIMLSIIASNFTNDITFGVTKQPTNNQSSGNFDLFGNSFNKPTNGFTSGGKTSVQGDLFAQDKDKEKNPLDEDNIIPDFLDGKF